MSEKRSAAQLDPGHSDLPPAQLRQRVAGTEDPEWFEVSGRMAIHDFSLGLERAGRKFGDFRSVYEFGCGCGRLTRLLAAELPHASLAASDVDGEAIAWLRANAAGLDARKTDPLPPLPFEDGSFDLILGWSVFTHFPEDYQDAWLAELARVAAPEAILLLTVNGRANFAWSVPEVLEEWSAHRRHTDPTATNLEDLRGDLASRGFTSFREDTWHTWLPSFYHTTFHTPEYVRSRWSRWFEVIDVLEGAAQPNHDMVVLSRGTGWRELGRRAKRGWSRS